MDHATEIGALEKQLAETDRAALATADVRRKLEALKLAQAAEQEARDRAREAEAAAAALAEARTAAGRAQAQPLIEADAALDGKQAALDAEVVEYLRGCIADARRFYERRCALIDEQNVLRQRIRACGVTGHDGVRAPDFAAFVRTTLWDFSYDGRNAWGALAREG